MCLYVKNLFLRTHTNTWEFEPLLLLLLQEKKGFWCSLFVLLPLWCHISCLYTFIALSFCMPCAWAQKMRQHRVNAFFHLFNQAKSTIFAHLLCDVVMGCYNAMLWMCVSERKYTQNLLEKNILYKYRIERPIIQRWIRGKKQEKTRNKWSEECALWVLHSISYWDKCSLMRYNWNAGSV